ncbi:hypothetical protein [Ideonella sp. A 288]|uniref:hypothetical protein n=1 Tax=Ideonella sp. A 288 TaxID=1962181 RepID=UPI00130373D6|nr:hypothetical protein [Ideonella sp. A 288]
MPITATARLGSARLVALGSAGHWACSGASHARWLQWHALALRCAGTPLPQACVADLRAASDSHYVWGWQSQATPRRVLLTHTGHVPGFMAEVLRRKSIAL